MLNLALFRTMTHSKQELIIFEDIVTEHITTVVVPVDW